MGELPLLRRCSIAYASKMATCGKVRCPELHTPFVNRDRTDPPACSVNAQILTYLLKRQAMCLFEGGPHHVSAGHRARHAPARLAG
jgi:hypothetical protein